MDNILLTRIINEVRLSNSVALAMITRIEGSTPATVGAMLVIPESGEALGTVGGGKLEAEVIRLAKKCLQDGQSQSFCLELESLPMICGGSAEVFIKVFVARSKLLIIGEGHVASEVYKLGQQLGFHTVVFGDRPEYANRERFPQADEIIIGAIEESLNVYPIDHHCSIVIVTRGHTYDEIALKSVINSCAGYIGMIGSHKKAHQVLQDLVQAGVSEEKLARVFTPIGLALGGNTPAEIAVSIMAEILLVKNHGGLAHLKDQSSIG